MTEAEHLLTCLAEEAAEIQQAVCKAQRFGIEDGYPGTDRTNEKDLNKEINHFFAILEMLSNKAIFHYRPIHDIMEEKKKKTRVFMQYARERGTLHD